jgi:hypothetical protein
MLQLVFCSEPLDNEKFDVILHALVVGLTNSAPVKTGQIHSPFFEAHTKFRTATVGLVVAFKETWAWGCPAGDFAGCLVQMMERTGNLVWGLNLLKGVGSRVGPPFYALF